MAEQSAASCSGWWPPTHRAQRVHTLQHSVLVAPQSEGSAESQVPKLMAAGCTALRASQRQQHWKRPESESGNNHFLRDICMFAAKPILILHDISTSKQTFVTAITFVFVEDSS